MPDVPAATKISARRFHVPGFPSSQPWRAESSESPHGAMTCTSKNSTIKMIGTAQRGVLAFPDCGGLESSVVFMAFILCELSGRDDDGGLCVQSGLFREISARIAAICARTASGP